MRAVRELLLTLAVFGLIGAAQAHAQAPFPQRRPAQDDSHVPLPGRPDRKAAPDLVNDALERAGLERARINQDLGDVAGLLAEVLKDPKRFGLTPERLEQLQKEFGKRPEDLGIDINDPKMQELARKLADQIKIPPDQLEAFKRVVGDIKPLEVKTPEIKPGDGIKPPEVKPIDPDKPPMPAEIKPPQPITQATVPPAASKRKPRTWLSEQLANLRLGNGGSLSYGLRDRIRSLLGRDTKLGGMTRGVGREAGRLLPKIDPAPFLRGLGKAVPDRIGRSPPKVNVPLGSPSFSAPSLPSGEGVGYGLVGILLVAGVFLVLLLMPRTREWITGRGDDWRLGPWPMAPSAIRTRDDLVKAFEYLALLRLGRKAGAANHLDIARQLGSTVEATLSQRAAAEELAGLYEQARYAPPQENLSSDEVETARRDLCFLAGVAAA